MPARLHTLMRRAPWALGLLAALATVVGVLLAIDRQADRHLAADAERAALGWARHLAANVPDIDLVFAGELASPQAQERLTSLRGSAGLHRFRLYDPAGGLRLVSDSVGTPPRAEDFDPRAAARAAAVAQRGQGLTLLHRGGIGEPAVYGESVVPVRHGQQVVGVVEVFLDLTEAAGTTAASFRGAALTAASALAAAFLVGGLFWHWRPRRERDTEARLQFLSRHDVITGALNAANFRELLARACAARNADPDAARGGLAVLCIDLDRFSDVNEAHGRGRGDRLLRAVAERLRGELRGDDLLARLAGDRYAVLQREVGDSGAVKALAQRIVESLSEPHRLSRDGRAVVATACVGAAIHGVDGLDADTLLRNAETALQRAKLNGAASWSFYDASLDRALQERRALAQDLRQTLAQDGLVLHFQPVFTAGGARLAGYEALARWSHPTRGAVPPSEFIAVAEETGQIETLGRLVLHGACREAARWPAPLSVAVNLSPAQFRRPGAIVDEVRAALADSGLAPGRLELEITESLLMNHTDQVLAALRALHALGVRIAMDDFGTGYSSLAYLWRFPFDKLKIDRAFTQGLGADDKVDAIVRSIVTLAHALAIRVNAEGVETESQRAALVRLGCDELQGFLLGRPQPPGSLMHQGASTPAPLPAPWPARPATALQWAAGAAD